MTIIHRTIGAVLLAGFMWQDAGSARAERSTVVGNAGTITLDWQATQDRAGRPLIEGHVITYGGKSGYCRPRLLVETLDAQGVVTASNVGFIPGYVGGFGDVYFQERVRAPGPAYRVSIASWDKCAGGGQ
ncbi:MAG TPA: hypothetical protein VEO00_05240 [Actinomycetota bacterium]|nr:hypothetical protein [Actinomycetota bacterium]